LHGTRPQPGNATRELNGPPGDSPADRYIHMLFKKKLTDTCIHYIYI